ncbi:MAG: DUF262 domain-containing protein [Kiritimatiellae bacterium]|nr:DUF262 domain-containing protein [Kiritimatiellia bacterium]
MNKEHELPIHDIPEVVFSIPWYQRGYRWTRDEVWALMDDLLAFCSEADEVYCLQPLVLERRNDGKTFVVDGQQRLTTIAIILHALKSNPDWDIEYTTEGNRKLSDLLSTPGHSINDYFRKRAQKAVEEWLEIDSSRCASLKYLLTGKQKAKNVVFLRHEIAKDEDGRVVFQRLNAGKTPLTSSELIRALFMEAGNGLADGEKADIAKEWDLIESAMTDEQFWAIWDNSDFRDVPTRMDFLFSIVAAINPQKARQDGLFIYREMEKVVQSETLAQKDKRKALKKMWETTLRCWWWMQSCYADEEAYHLLGWLAQFTGRGTRRLWEDWQKAGNRMDAFKVALRRLVIDRLGDRDLDSFRYGEDNSNELQSLFVLLNSLEAQRRHIRFRFDLYRKGKWDIEHIASQTDKPLKDPADQKEWLELAINEMSEDERRKLDGCTTFEERWNKVWGMFSNEETAGIDKHGIGNLALLDSGTNRAYKNAIFPAKRRTILGKSQKEEEKGKNVYIPPATEAAFAKSYSTAAAQMRYWSQKDAEAYLKGRKELFDGFM